MSYIRLNRIARIYQAQVLVKTNQTKGKILTEHYRNDILKNGYVGVVHVTGALLIYQIKYSLFLSFASIRPNLADFGINRVMLP